MNILVAGVCGFVGSMLAEALRELREALRFPPSIICGGRVRTPIAPKATGVSVIHGDIRAASDFETVPAPIGSSPGRLVRSFWPA